MTSTAGLHSFLPSCTRSGQNLLLYKGWSDPKLSAPAGFPAGCSACSSGLPESQQTLMVDALSLKEQGNTEFKAGAWLKSAATYTKAIKLEPENAVLFR